MIDLPQEQYKAFVNNLDLDWEFMISASDYELALFIKKKALEWKY